ncbi:MAG: hypothetical protein IJB15_03360, partial [Clostridia bacterium]|nr:hypothetical protein [Clostridia bacterium]
KASCQHPAVSRSKSQNFSPPPPTISRTKSKKKKEKPCTLPKNMLYYILYTYTLPPAEKPRPGAQPEKHPAI